MLREYGPPAPMLVGYDPCRDLPPDHLARLVEEVVEEALGPAPYRAPGPGQPAYSPRLCMKVIVYAYATGVRSSRAAWSGCARRVCPTCICAGGMGPRIACCAVRGWQSRSCWSGP